MTKQEFIGKIYPAALKISEETGMSWKLMLAQAVQETGWGQKILPDTNNIFNIKTTSSWNGNSKEFRVWEIENGQKVWVNDSFRVYNSIEDAFRDRVDFLKSNQRYVNAGLFDNGVLGNVELEAKALQDGRYATDPNYAKKLLEVINGRTFVNSVYNAEKMFVNTTMDVNTTESTQISNITLNTISLLRVGSTGKEVIQLQAKLKSLGYDVSVDGVFGEQTKKAVKDYQSDKGLSVDGVAGKDTLNSLNNNQSTNDAQFMEDELDKLAQNDNTSLDDTELTADSDQIKTDGSSDYFVDEKNKTIYYLDEQGNPTQVTYDDNSDLLIYGDPANPNKITFTDDNGDYQVWEKDKDGNFVQTNKVDYSQISNTAINQIGSLIIANNENFSNIEKIAVSSSVATIADFTSYAQSGKTFNLEDSALNNLQGAVVSFAVSAYFAKNDNISDILGMNFIILNKFYQKSDKIIYNIINKTNLVNNSNYINTKSLLVS